VSEIGVYLWGDAAPEAVRLSFFHSPYAPHWREEREKGEKIWGERARFLSTLSSESSRKQGNFECT
jgi:hypothetical protein